MNLYFIFGIISLLASIVGTICGIGGGVLIKPILDAFGVLSVPTISFLSSCTVLAMSLYSFIVCKINKDSLVDMKIGTPLAIGAAIGGVVGKNIFQYLLVLLNSDNLVGAAQSLALMLISIGTLLYVVYKDRIPTHQVYKKIVIVTIGFVLGCVSSFIGIGGGPINLVVLYFFFSMDTKTAAQNSLYIILFSQSASLLNTILTKSVPEFSPVLIALMVASGILGGLIGIKINRKIDENVVEKLFIAVMALIIIICAFNIFKFMI